VKPGDRVTVKLSDRETVRGVLVSASADLAVVALQDRRFVSVYVERVHPEKP